MEETEQDERACSSSPFDMLPEELVLEIFLLLPVESLGACAGVCSQWDMLLRTQTFWRSIIMIYDPLLVKDIEAERKGDIDWKTEFREWKGSTLVVGIHDASSGVRRCNDLADNLRRTGMRRVDVCYVDASLQSNQYSGTPLSETTLRRYPSVIFFCSCAALHLMETIGNLFADYMARGGGLVLCMFASLPVNEWKGRWRATYYPFGNYQQGSPQLGPVSDPWNLGAILVPDHPIMKGVRNIKPGTTCLRDEDGAAEHATVVARYRDGVPLVVELDTSMGPTVRKRTIVFVNLWPVSARVSADWYDPECDIPRLLRNAAAYVARRGAEVRVVEALKRARHNRSRID